MRKVIGYLLVVVIFLAVLFGVFFFIGSNSLVTTENSSNVSINGSWKEIGEACNSYTESRAESFTYPGANAFTHGQDKYQYCSYLYEEALQNDNPEVCSYLKNDTARAVCVGSASKNVDDTSLCDSFSGQNKDVCLLNVLIKDSFKYNISSKNSSESLCSRIENDVLRALCKGPIAKQFDDPRQCNFEGELQLICLQDYLIKDVTLPLTKEEATREIKQCDSFFDSDSLKVRCYMQSTYENLHTLVNATSYGSLDTVLWNFYDYSMIANEKLIVSVKRTKDGPGAVFDYYVCESIPQDIASISSKCTVLKDSCKIAQQCSDNIPYYSFGGDYYFGG